MGIVKLKAGAELDAAVAKTVGLPFAIYNGSVLCHIGDHAIWRDGPNVEFKTIGIKTLPWSPSTSIDHAFEAAEKFRLFDFRAIGKDDGWEVIEHQGNGEYTSIVERCETAPLAICAAILKLEGIECGPTTRT